MPHHVSRRLKTSHQLPFDGPYMGLKSPWAWLWATVFAMVPLSYAYVALVVLRELCQVLDAFGDFLHRYLPWLYALQHLMRSSSVYVEVWCAIEALFFLLSRLHISYLQTRDPLEASLSAAPIMTLRQRQQLWDCLVEAEARDPVGHLQGWFFAPWEHISADDVRDFVAWSMFEGRHQEHLTSVELTQLEDFLRDLQLRISLQLYGEAEDYETEDYETADEASLASCCAPPRKLPKPKECE